MKNKVAHEINIDAAAAGAARDRDAGAPGLEEHLGPVPAAPRRSRTRQIVRRF